VVPGTLRLDEPGGSLDCLLLAPAPDWVAIDIATGALVRSSIATDDTFAALSGSPLSHVALRVAPMQAPWDPSRPDAIIVSDVAEAAALSRRSARRLVARVARSGDDGGLLGSVGPSLAFADLEGTRPSIAVVSPVGGRVRLTGEDSLTAHFNLGERAYSMRVAPGAARWLRTGQVPTSSDRPARRGGRTRRDGARPHGPGAEMAVPVLLVVGLDRPHQGQVRKTVLGLVPAA
jgi:hypothetical protein